MITRGHFIGQIIDELSSISHQVETRSGLGLTDLNRHLENFFKELLNIILDERLKNLNAERSNNPGLDLGDKTARTAFQVTSTKTSDKINATLTKVTDDDIKLYDKIRVLIIGKKQGTYTLDPTLCTRCKFAESDIWDIGDLCKLLMDIKLDRLETAFKYVSSEVVRVRIELEIPNTDGKFPTSVADYVEKIPKPTIGTCDEYCRIQKEIESGFDQSPEDVQKDLMALSQRLAKLPRITREFFAILLERRDDDDPLMIRDDKLRRICKWPDINGELRLLEAEGLARIREGDYPAEGAEIRMHLPGFVEKRKEAYGYLYIELPQFVERKRLNFQKVIANMDFSDF